MTWDPDAYAREFIHGQAAYRRGEPLAYTKIKEGEAARGCPWDEHGPRPELYQGWVAGWRHEYREART